MANEKVVKVTKRENINSLLAREDLTENERKFLTHELELLDKKNAYKAEKNLEKNVENEKLKNEIFSVLSEHTEGVTTSIIANELSEKLGRMFTPQKVRPLLSSLMADEKVENYKEKGVSLFRVVG